MDWAGREVRIRNCLQMCQAHFATLKSSLGARDAFSHSLCQSVEGVLSVSPVFEGNFSTAAKQAVFALINQDF